jgi:hypothetical protein
MKKKARASTAEGQVGSWVARWFVFKPKKIQFGFIFEGLAMEDVILFYGRLVYFMAIYM